MLFLYTHTHWTEMKILFQEPFFRYIRCRSEMDRRRKNVAKKSKPKCSNTDILGRNVIAIHCGMLLDENL